MSGANRDRAVFAALAGVVLVAIVVFKSLFFGSFHILDTGAMYTDVEHDDVATGVFANGSASILKCQGPATLRALEASNQTIVATFLIPSQFSQPWILAIVEAHSPDSDTPSNSTAGPSYVRRGLADSLIISSHQDSSHCHRLVVNISFRCLHKGKHRLHARFEYRSVVDAVRDPGQATATSSTSLPPYLGVPIPSLSPFILDCSTCLFPPPTARPCSGSSTGYWEFPTNPDSQQVEQFALSCPASAADQPSLWIPHDCQLPKSTRETARSYLQKTPPTFLGDSVVRGLYQTLQCALKDTPNLAGRFHPVQAVMPNSLFFIRDFFQRRNQSQVRGGVLVINPAGLWQCAYGSLAVWERGIREIATWATESTFANILWLTTSAVHPKNFFTPDSDWYDDAHMKKWFMTEPRVRRLNQVTMKVLEEHPFSLRIQVLDTWQISALREDDPAEVTDMRHYGPATQNQMLRLILSFIS
eukprot:c13528_g1_i1.p1 GENE.c13528_g1_i1~~c13528_g1_i1.p1  ORF type:complete len:490 (+),score=66.96 c13528_g1_i1:54-1472(+)